jgi:hypothetical protein
MLFWQGSAREDYTVFVHVVGASSAPPLVQADSQPGAGTFPTSRWMAGQTIVDEYALEAPPGDYQVQVGMYLLATGKRLPAFDAAGERLANDRILLP